MSTKFVRLVAVLAVIASIVGNTGVAAPITAQRPVLALRTSNRGAFLNLNLSTCRLLTALRRVRRGSNLFTSRQRQIS
jgi:hypothetical protein